MDIFTNTQHANMETAPTNDVSWQHMCNRIVSVAVHSKSFAGQIYRCKRPISSQYSHLVLLRFNSFYFTCSVLQCGGTDSLKKNHPTTVVIIIFIVVVSIAIVIIIVIIFINVNIIATVIIIKT